MRPVTHFTMGCWPAAPSRQSSPLVVSRTGPTTCGPPRIPAVKAVPHLKLAHPAGVDREGTGDDAALKAWAGAVTKLRKIVTADPDGDARGPNFGSYFTETDYARIPRWDLPAVAPAYLGDDSWGRGATPRHNNCCERPSPDDMVSLLLSPPAGQGEFLQYRYQNGKLAGAKRKDGTNVTVDAFGIPV